MSEVAHEIDLAAATGAEAEPSLQVLTVYVPDRDRDDCEFGQQRKWVLAFARLLSEIGGGVTVMPPAEGGWFNEETGKPIWERTVLVYTYIKPDPFRRLLPDLRGALHRFGRETNQGEVVFEFDGELYRIRDYDGQ